MAKMRTEVHMGEGIVARAPQVISSSGIGSCVVLALYDRRSRIGGLAHIMLPSSQGLRVNPQPYHCVDTAIAALLRGVQARGAKPGGLVAKIAGGAQMFSRYQESNSGIGERNVRALRRRLKEARVYLLGEDVGGHHGRSLEFHLESGRLIIQSLGWKEVEL